MPDPALASLLILLDEAFRRKSWHGPNLRGSLRGLSTAQVTWRPAPDRRSIAEIAIHTAYWKYSVRRRLLGEPRGSFALKGSNWFPIAPPLAEEEWKRHLALLEAEHKQFLTAVAELPAHRLDQTPAGSSTSFRRLIQGAALHDVYHAGQIQLLKRLQGGE